jgi:chorismate synthase
MASSTDITHTTARSHDEGALDAAVTITEPQGPARLIALEELQARAWEMEPRGIVPGALMGIIASGGGILLAAYDRDHGDRPIGFVLGLLARRDGRLYHASHMLATDPAYQGRGIGAALKRRQREVALAQGLDLMTWTFDPLIARNAHLNLHKLGAISSAYYEDYYGPMDDRFNGGLPTDRLLVEWRLNGPVPPVPLSVFAPLTPILIVQGGKPVLRLERAPVGAPLSVWVPGDSTAIKERDPAAALDWRLALRRALSWAFAHGYVARDFSAGAYVLLPEETSG